MADFLTIDSLLPPYLAFPRFLLELDISETAKLLYMILLDRARLSLQNDGWKDENGHVFIFYTIKNMAATLHRSDMTIKTALNILSAHDLIFRFRQGAGNPNRIYVKIPTDRQKPFLSQTDRNLSYGEQESFPMDGQETVCQRDRILSSNNKEINNNKRKKKESNAAGAYGSYQNVCLTAQELTTLQADIPNWSGYIERLSAYMESTGKIYQSHAATIRLWASKDKPTAAPTKRTYDCKEGESL